jgi:hypothetical protein
MSAGTAAAEGPDTSWTVVAFVLVIAAAFGAWGLYELVDPKLFRPPEGISAFAPMYILAQAIERLLEPFSNHLATAKADGKQVTKPEAELARDAAFANLLDVTKTDPEALATRAAAAQALLDRVKRNTAVIAWALASVLAMAACGAFGIRLLTAIGFDAPPFWDIAISGLAIGSGTKPLHDLISNLQKSKENKANPPGVVTAA